MPQVLIAEDETVLARNLAIALRRLDIDATVVTSYQSAMQAVSQCRFDMICTDINLGDGSGLELSDRVRSTLPDVPIIVFTGQDSVENRVRAEDFGPAAFLTKPFSLARFRELVSTLLDTPLPDRPPRADVRSKLSVLMYSHDSIGLGHMRRNASIAAQIARTHPGASILMLVGSPTGTLFELAPGVDVIKLPSIAKVGVDVWLPSSLRIPASQVGALRAGLIERAVQCFAPDVILVDHEPAGVWDELRGALRYVRTHLPATRVVLGLRDILDEPDKTRSRWRDKGIDELIRYAYDQVFVYGSQDVYPSAQLYGLDQISPMLGVQYCGYVVARSNQRRTTDALPGQRPRLLISGAGGRDAYPMITAALQALESLAAERRPLTTVVSGPLMEQEFRDALRERCLAMELEFHASCNDLTDRLVNADLLMTMGGYNSVLESIAAGCPTLVIPRIGPSAEQRIRAATLAARGLLKATTIHPGLVVELAAEFSALTVRSKASPVPLPIDGAEVAARALIQIGAARIVQVPT